VVFEDATDFYKRDPVLALDGIAENAFISDFVISNKDEKSTSEEPEAEKKPVLFQLPDDWDDLSDEEQEKIADQIIEAMTQG
jgi:hypothetical protein